MTNKELLDLKVNKIKDINRKVKIMKRFLQVVLLVIPTAIVLINIKELKFYSFFVIVSYVSYCLILIYLYKRVYQLKSSYIKIEEKSFISNVKKYKLKLTNKSNLVFSILEKASFKIKDASILSEFSINDNKDTVLFSLIDLSSNYFRGNNLTKKVNFMVFEGRNNLSEVLIRTKKASKLDSTIVIRSLDKKTISAQEKEDLIKLYKDIKEMISLSLYNILPKFSKVYKELTASSLNIIIKKDKEKTFILIGINNLSSYSIDFDLNINSIEENKEILLNNCQLALDINHYLKGVGGVL